MREIKLRVYNKLTDNIYKVKSIDWDDVGNLYHVNGVTVNPYYIEVMQFTGLKDKNGKEIYEGDVVKRTIYPLNQYSYDEYYQIKELNYYIYKGEKYGHFNVSLWSTDCEVIGNIHNNPELLEVL